MVVAGIRVVVTMDVGALVDVKYADVVIKTSVVITGAVVTAVVTGAGLVTGTVTSGFVWSLVVWKTGTLEEASFESVLKTESVLCGDLVD